MNTPGSRLTEAEAHQELMLMDSRVAGMPLESFFDRLRRLDLPYADVLARFRDVLNETRSFRGQHIHLGKIIGQEMLEFMESDPDLPSGLQLQSALRGLGQAAPFLAPVLAPLTAEVESQGFGRSLGQSEFREKMDRRAVVFFRRTADILNLTKYFLSADQSAANLDVVTFDEPALFELETSENPFDLDHLASISPTCLAVAKVLVKIALADGHFRDQERIVIAQSLEHMGEALSESQFERLAAEASKESMQEILKTVTDQPVAFKEKLLLLAMLATAADGRVETIEKKLLAQAAPMLGIDKQRFSQIAREAVGLIKTRKASLAESARPIAHSAAQSAQPRPALEQARGATAVEPDRPRPSQGPIPALPDKVDVSPRTRATLSSAPPTSAQAETVPKPSASDGPQDRKTWRCPACQMPQFQQFEECPQCGVIVSKFMEKHGQAWGHREEDVMVDIPTGQADEPVRKPGQPPSQPASTKAASFCGVCGVALPAGAKFCPACGTRVV